MLFRCPHYDKLIYDNLVYIISGDAEQSSHYRILSLSIFLRLIISFAA